MITQSIIINLIPSGIPPRIKVSQYDTGAEAIEVTLLNGTEVYEIPADATVLLTGRTSGGQVFTKKATTASGSVAMFGVIDAMTASAGTAKAEVEILDGQTVLGSANFDIYVEPSPVRKDNTAESDWSDLQAMANAVVAAGKKIDDAEQVVADATDAASKAHEAITAIGDNVERSETAATSAEAAQTAAEAAQGKAESAQTAAETAEQSASASATTATTKATEAETNASAAAESVDAAKAWAVGPSDELTAGTDTDNAKYYAAQAKASADKAESISDVGIATTSTAGIVKPDGDTITIDEDGTIHGVSKITVDDALSDTSENPVQNKAIKAAIDAQNETIGHLLILKITFSEEFKGKAYTVTGNGETFTGTVPNSLYINLHVHGLDSIYTVSAEYEGVPYSNKVETKDFYGVYFGELTAWQATITVTVTDSVAGAVEGALVTATSTEKEYTQTTNAEGKAEIKVGKSGTYTIVAKNADGELTDTQEVVADTDKGTYIAEVSYWRATLTVTVTDKGVGVAGAKVTAASADKTYGPVATDAEGKVTIKIGKAGTYTVKAVNAEGEETNPKPVEITTAGETYTVNCSYLAIVTWKEGTAEQIAAMITAANNGEINLSEYWTAGEEVNTQTVTDIAANADYMALVCGNDVALSVLCSASNAVSPITSAIQNYRATVVNTLSNSSLFAKTSTSLGHSTGTGNNTNSFYIPTSRTTPNIYRAVGDELGTTAVVDSRSYPATIGALNTYGGSVQIVPNSYGSGTLTSGVAMRGVSTNGRDSVTYRRMTRDEGSHKKGEVYDWYHEVPSMSFDVYTVK